MKLKKPVLLATIGAPQGVKGEVRVKSFTADPLALGDYGSLYDSDGHKFKVKRLRPAKAMLVVKFEGVNSRDEAAALRNRELFIDRSALPDNTEDDEFYVTDLIGLEARDESGNLVGNINDVPDFGAGSLLEIAPSLGDGFSGKTFFLEFKHENVPTVDLEAGVVVVKLPPEVSERDKD